MVVAEEEVVLLVAVVSGVAVEVEAEPEGVGAGEVAISPGAAAWRSLP